MMRLLMKALLWGVRSGLFVVWFAIPWVWRTLLFVLLLTATSLGSLRTGVHYTVHVIEEEWMARAIKAGLPQSWECQFRKVFSVLALFTLVAGWLATAFIAVFMISQLF
jgi:hypothetical protein